MASLIFFVSCTKDNLIDDNIETVDFTGKELFKGIFFANGVVAESVPSIRNSFSYYELSKIDNNQKQEFESRMEEILSEIELQNPEFFQKFKKELQTKNQLKIEEALREGSQLLFESAVNLYLSNEQKQQIEGVINKTNIEDFRNDDGSINYESLKIELEKNNELNLSEQGRCWFAGVVFVAAAYVLVVHAAAAMTYVGVAWVAEYYAAIDQEKAVTRDKSANQVLNSELLINDLAVLNIR